MEKTVTKIKEVKLEIMDIEASIENVKTLPYYDVFHRETDRERDLKECRGKLKEKYNELHSLLEKLAQEVSGELSTLSYQQRKNNTEIITASPKHEVA